MIRGSCFAASVVALACWSSSARAAPGDATRLEYARSARAARCPDRDALESAVAKRLGYEPFFPAARQSIVVEITDADDGALRAQMHLIDDKGIIVGSSELRERAEHCDELVASLALAISIALDPSAALGAAPDAAPAEPESAAPREPKQESEAAPEAKSQQDAPLLPAVPKSTPTATATPARRPAGARRLDLPMTARAAAFGSLGVAPAVAFGWRAGVGLRWESFQIVAEFADQLPASRAASAGGRTEASLFEGTLVPCWLRSSLAACALLSVGELQSEGKDIPEPARRSSSYVALGARAEYTPTLFGTLHLLLATDVLRALTPITFRLRGEEVWHTPLLALALSAGLELRFR